MTPWARITRREDRPARLMGSSRTEAVEGEEGLGFYGSFLMPMKIIGFLSGLEGLRA